MAVLAVGACSLALTAVTVPLCIVIARHWDVLDRPGPLKPQLAPVPYLGGLAVFCGVVVGALAAHPTTLVPITAALVLGLADDKLDLSTPVRLIGQVGIGVLVVVAEPVHLAGWVGVPLVVLASVALINGYNMLDGIDMLAAGVGAVAALGFALLLAGAPRLLAVAIGAALLGFLWYNRPPARIYLGDGGSYLVGATMAVLLASTWGTGVAIATGVVALALVAVPIAEVVCAVVRRWRGGRPLAAGDRGHPYDLLVTRGWSATAASVAYIGIQGAIVVVVALVDRTSLTVAVVVDAAVAVALLSGAAAVGGLSGYAEARQ